MYRVFGKISNCLNHRDDILIEGIDLEEHNKPLKVDLQRAKDFGYTLNREKCEIRAEDMEFYGYKFTIDGLRPKN